MSQENNDSNESKNSDTGEKTEHSYNEEGTFTEKVQSSDASRQTESSNVTKLREQWEVIGMKTYAEIASALPGGTPEGYASHKNVHNEDASQGHPMHGYQTHQDQDPRRAIEKTSQTHSQHDLQELPIQHQESHPLSPVEQQLQESHRQGYQDKSSQVCELLSPNITMLTHKFISVDAIIRKESSVTDIYKCSVKSFLKERFVSTINTISKGKHANYSIF